MTTYYMNNKIYSLLIPLQNTNVFNKQNECLK